MSTFPNKCLVYGATGVESTTKQLQLRPNDLLVRVSQVGLNPVDAKQVIGDKLPGSLQSLARRFVQGSTIGYVVTSPV
jgi:NADPH:quinone reductase-like Zn-dependent oxidoreductase